MRIAVTGTHGSGKSTLIADLVEAHPAYEAVPEPYWDLTQLGVAFMDEPSSADFADQLAHSVRTILDARSEPNIVFDRSPIDFIAYLEVLNESKGEEWVPSGTLLRRIEAALETLDLLVFLPLSIPDEISETIEHPKLRRAVDARLKLILREDSLGLAELMPKVLEITGSRNMRNERLSAALS